MREWGGEGWDGDDGMGMGTRATGMGWRWGQDRADGMGIIFIHVSLFNT